ncbi:MAG: AAA family ATPase [Planctomycetes bacterium]|nr:AAA family ATPase [Planctomycetota bacterium]
MNSRLSEIPRILRIDLEGTRAAFLWGPRKVGKTTLLRRQFPRSRVYDLLDTDLRTRLLLRPSILREECLAARDQVVVVDEVQKIPSLLDEVHWLIENADVRFVLAGSSARKLRRGASNLLGGRAWRYELFPLTTREVPDLDLERALNHGLVPAHYLSARADRSLRSYVLDYLAEEIQAEALTRNVPAFARFLDSVAAGHGSLLNYASVARDCGVAAKTVREYYQILEDTLLGHALLPWLRARKRRLIETAKFYLFDVGLVRALRGMAPVRPRTAEFGQAFEHFLVEEVRAYLSYSEKNLPLSFWRTSTGLEVDLILGDLDLALEFKAVAGAGPEVARGLRALREEHPLRRAAVVTLDTVPRKFEDGTLVLPWREFCARLWDGDLV